MGEGQRRRRRNWAGATDGLSGVIDDDMPGRNVPRKLGTTPGSPRRSRTAKAPRITGPAGKSRRAPEWGGWGRISVDGPGHYNPDRSEGPWGRAARAVRMAVLAHTACSDTEPRTNVGSGGHEGRMQTGRARHVGATCGKAPFLISQLCSRTGGNPPYGMIGGRWKRRHHTKPGPRHRPARPCRKCLKIKWSSAPAGTFNSRPGTGFKVPDSPQTARAPSLRFFSVARAGNHKAPP